MSRLRSALTLLAGSLLAVSAVACNKADAAAGAAATTAGSTAPGSAQAPATGGLLAAVTPATDSISDSLLVFRADRGRLMGPESGAIWVVMISDFQCPYCKSWHDEAMAKVTNEYVKTGQVRMAYLNLPLQQHKYARAESEAALCAAVQDKFWPYAEQLFARQQEIEKAPLIQPILDEIARGLTIDMPAFASCQKREAIRALVDSDIQQATRAGVRSTPSFMVGDFLVEGAVPYTDFRRAIDTALVMAKNKGTR